MKDLLFEHPIASLIVLILILVVAWLVWKRYWGKRQQLSTDGMYYEGGRGAGWPHGPSTPNDYYVTQERSARRLPRRHDGEDRAKGQGMTPNPDDLHSPNDSNGRGSSLGARLGYGGQSEQPSGMSSGTETQRQSRKNKDENPQVLIEKKPTAPTSRAEGPKVRTPDDLLGIMEDRFTRLELQLADINLTVSQLFQTILRQTGKEGTPGPEPVSRAPQPAVRRTTTLDDIVQFWNEGADWGDPDTSLRDYGQQILRDGWRILGPVKTFYRVVMNSKDPSRIFLFPYLKKAKKYYPPDFFAASGSADSKQLVRPAQVQLLAPGANLDHEIVRLGGGETRFSDVFEVVEKGEII